MDVEYFRHNPRYVGTQKGKGGMCNTGRKLIVHFCILWFLLFSTVENLAVFIWGNFNLHLQKDFGSRSSTAKLYKVKIYETEHNSVEYLGEGDV